MRSAWAGAALLVLTLVACVPASGEECTIPEETSISGCDDTYPGQVCLKCTEVEGRDYFRIYRSESASGPYTEIGQTPAGGVRTYYDSDVSPCTTYWYQARAISECGAEGPMSGTWSAMADGCIEVTSPNGGEDWEAGTTQSVEWECNKGTGTHSNIYLSTDSGSSWTPIATQTANDGQYDWAVPDTASSECRIRVTNPRDPSISDTSDSDFAISGPAVLEPPSNPSPEDGATDLSELPFLLQWRSGQEEGVVIEFEVYLSDSRFDSGPLELPGPLSRVVSDKSWVECPVENLRKGRTYYWQVVATLGRRSVESAVWSFTGDWHAAPYATLSSSQHGDAAKPLGGGGMFGFEHVGTNGIRIYANANCSFTAYNYFWSIPKIALQIRGTGEVITPLDLSRAVVVESTLQLSGSVGSAGSIVGEPVEYVIVQDGPEMEVDGWWIVARFRSIGACFENGCPTLCEGWRAAGGCGAQDALSRGNPGMMATGHVILEVPESPVTRPIGIELQHPEDGAAIESPSASLQWNVPSGTPLTNYRVFLGAEGVPEQLVMDFWSGGVGFNREYPADALPGSPDLQEGETYYWRIAAFNGEGRYEEAGPWSFGVGSGTATTPVRGTVELQTVGLEPETSVFSSGESGSLRIEVLSRLSGDVEAYVFAELTDRAGSSVPLTKEVTVTQGHSLHDIEFRMVHELFTAPYAVAVVLWEGVSSDGQFPTGKMIAAKSFMLSYSEAEEAPVPEADDHADHPALATEILAGEQITGEIHTAPDVDLFRVEVQGHCSYTLSLHSEHEIGPSMRVYLAHSEEELELLAEDETAVGWTLAEPAVLYAAVSTVPTATPFSVQHYSLSLTMDCTGTSDSIQPTYSARVVATSNISAGGSGAISVFVYDMANQLIDYVVLRNSDYAVLDVTLPGAGRYRATADAMNDDFMFPHTSETMFEVTAETPSVEVSLYPGGVAVPVISPIPTSP